MVVATTGPAGVLYKKWTAKDAANFDGTNDTIAEYVGFMLGAVASKATRTLTRPMNTSGEKPKKKYRLVAQPLVEGGAPSRDSSGKQVQGQQQQDQPGSRRLGLAPQNERLHEGVEPHAGHVAVEGRQQEDLQPRTPALQP